MRATLLTAVLLVASGSAPLAAQIDYRNLDDHRPVRTEDAYPIERYAFELLVPYEFEDEAAHDRHHLVAPELAYGVAANTQVGLKLPFAAVDDGVRTTWGFGGPRLFGLYNFNTESLSLPALSVRADLAVPAGGLAGDDPQLTLKAIATRSWGLTRLHLNALATVGDDGGRPLIDAAPEWAVTAAVDRTFFRRSLLLVAELGVLEAAPGAPTQVDAAAGLRYQLTPTLVVDAGVSRRLADGAGPDLGLTLGLSHAFSFAGLLPAPR